MIVLDDNKAVDLIATAQTLTGSWVDIGDEIFVADKDLVSLWVELDINSSTGVKIRALASYDKAFPKSYVLPIQNIAANVVSLLPQVFSFDNDVDQNVVIPLDVGDVAPHIKFQVMTTVVGVSAGQILSAKVSAKTTA